MLTFEWNEESEALEIHADIRSLSKFASQLEKLASIEGDDHLHLMTADWGGDELSSDRQNNHSKLIHHVKIFKWRLEDAHKTGKP